ncbi:Fyve finger containing protein, partial [Globisporangium splendens]
MARPTSYAGGATWTPLRENYFATPLLSAKEKTYLVRKSCEAAQEVVERARSTGGPVQWRHVEKYQDVQIYAGQPRGTFGSQSQSADIMSMCGVTSVAASVKEIAALFDLSTTRAMKEFSMDNRDLFYDAIVLYNLSPRTKEKPLHQVTAKWITVKCPRGVEDRDFCYLECQDKFVDSTGRKGWVMCLHSIKLPGCDELTREFGFVRGSFYHSGFIVVETDRPGYVDVIHMLQINFKKNTRVSPSFMRDRVAFVAKIRTMMRDKRLNEQRYLSDLELVPKKYRSRCTVCQDSFTLLLLRKMNCRKCGEVVCGACSKEFDIKNAKFMETVKIRVCMQCFQLITTVPKSAQIPMLEQSRQSTTMSFLGYYEDEQRASFMTQVPSSAVELAETSANRRTKIFLQSMQKPRSSSARVPSSAPAPRTTVYGIHPPRSSTQLRPSQIIGGFPSMGSTMDPYSRDTISYHHQPPPPSAASIFDRPAQVSGPPASHSRDFDYNRYSEYGHHQPMPMPQQPRKRSISSEQAHRSQSASIQQQSSQQEYDYNMPPMHEYSMTDFPPPVAYPDSLRGSESKQRDSESSNSSIDIDADEGRESLGNPPPMNEFNAQRGRSNSRSAPVASPPPYYADDGRRHNDRVASPEPPPYYAADASGRLQRDQHAPPPAPPSYYSDDIDDRSDRQRRPQETTSSFYSDDFDVLSDRPDQIPPGPVTASFYSNDIVDSEYNDMIGEDSDEEGSMGSEDESEFSPDLIPLGCNVSGTSEQQQASGMVSRREEEETKAQELADTPAYPPPSASAYEATREMLSRESLVYSSSLHQKQDAEQSQSQSQPKGDETVESKKQAVAFEKEIAHDSRDSEHKYELRDSELGLNTTVCDMSFLDSDMRQFHDQSLFMVNGRPTVDNSDGSQKDNASVNGQSQARASSGENASDPAPSLRRRPSSGDNNKFQDAFSRPFLTATPHITSPRNSLEGRPSLYGKPRESRRTSARNVIGATHHHHHQQVQRSGTIALFKRDNSRPGSFSSAGSSSSNTGGGAFFGCVGNEEEPSQQQRSNGSNPANSSGSSGGGSNHEKEQPSASFFGAIPDDVLPHFQQPKSMANFSAASTYEVPERSAEEAKELIRKLSAQGMHSHHPHDNEPEHESKANHHPAWFGDDDDEHEEARDSDFDIFDESIVQSQQPQSATRGAQMQLQPGGDHEDEEDEEDVLLSARSLYKTFGNTLKITSLVGGDQNDKSLQRTFSKIQESINMLSSDSEDSEGDHHVDYARKIKR